MTERNPSLVMTAAWPLKIASISDVHLGHKRTPTSEIVHNLYGAFPDNAETGELDLIVIAGDLWDRLLIAPDDSFSYADPWLAYMLRICARYDIVLRILEGTPSHDWKQSERINTIEQMTKSGADVKYVKDLSIEYIEKLGIHVLYVPDEWETSTDKTLDQARALVRAKGLEQVDFAFMHGTFAYQLPDFVKAQKHDEAAYMALVKHLIFIGHHHSFSNYRRIFSHGSFDRLAHGEEEPKGHLRASVCGGEYDVRFIENKGAKPYVTINCIGLTLEDTLILVDQTVARLPECSNVRIEADQSNPILVNMELLIRNYPTYTWSKLVREADEPERPEYEPQDEVVYQPIAITRDNLSALLLPRLAKHSPSAAVLAAAEEMMKEVL